jgi:hypothetical protein
LHIDSPFYQLGLTLVFETIVYTLFLNWFRVKKVWQDLCYLLLINAFTWPLAFYFYNAMGVSFPVVECVVFLLEWIFVQMYFELGLFRAFVMSLVTNVISMFFGLLFG